jgi:hypothetical protein
VFGWLRRRGGRVDTAVVCRRCGAARVDVARIRVHRVVRPDLDGGAPALVCETTTCRCPTCERVLVLAVSSRDRDALVRSGVRVDQVAAPAEFDEIRAGEPLCESDLDAFCALLDDEDHLAEFCS